MDEMMQDELVAVIKDLVAAENRYKDGISDERWTDAEMASRKRTARDNAIAVTKKLGYDILDLRR